MDKTLKKKQECPIGRHNKLIADDTSGQVSLDFISGTIIFMVTFMFVFQTLSSLFIPFMSNTDEIKSMSDRVANTLVGSNEGLVNNPTQTNIISLRRALIINSIMNTSEGYDNLINKWGLYSDDTLYSLNISLRYVNNTVYSYKNNTVLNNGPVPPDNGNVAQSIRIVYIDMTGDIAKLYVRVW